MPTFKLLTKQIIPLDIDAMIAKETRKIFFKYPRLVIDVLKNTHDFEIINVSDLKKFVIKLPVKSINFIEKQYNKLNLKNKIFNFFFPLLLENPNLSYKTHPKVYKRSLIDFMTYCNMILNYIKKPINIPENVVDILTYQEAYKIIIKGVNIQKFFINLPIEKLTEKAFIYILANPQYLEKIRETIQEYKELKNYPNAKNAKIAFYKYCFNKMINGKKDISTLLREIFEDFSQENKNIATLLIEKVISEEKVVFNNKYKLKDKIFYLKRDPLPGEDDIFNKYKTLIFKICNRGENYGCSNQGY